MQIPLRLTLFMLLAGSMAGIVAQVPTDLVWSRPSIDANGSMPLGNGTVGLNAWVEKTGDLVFYISRGDAWSGNGRLLKLGKVRVKLSPAPDTATFEQRLVVSEGILKVHMGEGAQLVEMELWVDAYRPLIHVSVRSQEPHIVEAKIEAWRNTRESYPIGECSDLMEDRSRPDNLHSEVWVERDLMMGGLRSAIGWYHHNKKSVGPALIARTQGLDDYFRGRPDPLLRRTFGAVIAAPKAKRLGRRALRLKRGRSHLISIAALTTVNSSVASWSKAVQSVLGEAEDTSIEERNAAHVNWWRAFWGRSHIHVFDAKHFLAVPQNAHAVRIGLDQNDGSQFSGDIASVGVWPRALSSKELEECANSPVEEKVPASETALASQAQATKAAIDASEKWTFEGGLTISAWVRPMSGGSGRIVDNITPGGKDGFLFDTYPGKSLRFIVGGRILKAKDVLDADKWTHVSAVINPLTGHMSLRVSGQIVAEKTVQGTDDATLVSRTYELQRYVDACAGRGRYPIKFNGSIFTVPQPGHFGGADFRRWGPGYWWQNTRLPYLSMCASGDTEMMKPLFRMYADDLLALHKHRTMKQTGHAGAFIPECMYFWGPQFSGVYGWTPLTDRGEDRLQDMQWHKREWVAGLELVWMMLDYYEHTMDERFLKETLLPTAHEILTFFDLHYNTGDDGKLVMNPAQALEVWWDCTNPMPEVAGLHAVLGRLSTLPQQEANASARAFWTQLAARIPDLPTRKVGKKTMLAPAAVYKNKHNVENPELYAVFPFRLVAFEKPNASLGLEALKHRWDRGAFGWRQDDLFMAYLGLANDARTNLIQRARNKHAASRFPVFWGPNYDWIPDQDHGGVLMRTLQAMLMQTDGRKIHLLPAWPKDWNADFRLHAPFGTVVQGTVKDGKVYNLQVSPAARQADVIVH